MGVSIPSASGRSEKRPLDAELNLIPFIDLLVCCICFLLITAVWSQLATIRTSTSQGSRVVQGDPLPPAPRLKLLVGEQGFTLTVGSERLFINRNGARHDADGLARHLQRIHGRLPFGSGLTAAAEDGVPYRDLILAMDIARQQRFLQVSVSDAGAIL